MANAGAKVKKRWGYYKILLRGKGFWVKMMAFKGASTSLQSHRKRDEIWLIYVPAGAKHRIGGRGNVLEIAIGDPRERDIVRYKEK